MESKDSLWDYENNGYKQVEGWMGDGLFPRLRLCAAIQGSFNEKGGAVEIGVHHGQFFIALNQLCAENEPSMAIDVFDAQHLNIDSSGGASRQKLEDNLMRYCRHQGRNVQILAADSTTLTASHILRELSMKPRFFSVDGGHTAEHTINDLALAHQCISDFGVIFVDDILNPDWLGVIEGVCRYMMRSPTIFPFALNSNKLFFCRISAYTYYLQTFSELPVPQKKVEFFGKTVLVS